MAEGGPRADHEWTMSRNHAETAPRLRVLVVDDSAAFRAALCEYLALIGTADVVGEAADGADATEQAERLRPTLVLMDVQMPRCSGIEAAKRMRALEPRPHIVLFSLHADAMLRSAALAAGADELYRKDDFIAHVAETLARCAQHQNATGARHSSH
jgi:DNA-binding NarL/FixJ family response regulator